MKLCSPIHLGPRKHWLPIRVTHYQIRRAEEDHETPEGVVREMDRKARRKILKEPKNSLVKQYQKLFRFEKVKLSFTDDALHAMARKAVERKTGARGLRTIIETIMLDIMYEVPSRDNIREVVITEDVITEGKPPRVEPVQSYGVPG